ncbi:MAG TPA: DUF2059 domain-containing protein [Rhizomicrobium sp.]|jgi:hypothetical protein|nr:DUF2059 domain-containing protein [Rhizomicrobium sp.]
MMPRAACLALMLLGAGTNGFAQDAPPTPQTLAAQDPQKVALAAKILQETHTQDNMALLLDSLIPQMVGLVKRQSPDLSDDTMKLLSDLLLQAMKDRLPQLMILNSQIYAEHFTLDELKAIDTFQNGEAGQKAIAEAPKILRETTPIGAAWGRAAAQGAMSEVIAKLRAKGVKI